MSTLPTSAATAFVGQRMRGARGQCLASAPVIFESYLPHESLRMSGSDETR
jgi:hypothetical protein